MLLFCYHYCCCYVDGVAVVIVVLSCEHEMGFTMFCYYRMILSGCGGVREFKVVFILKSSTVEFG